MANPDKPVVVITGDGSLGFYIAELDTAVRHNLPIVVIVGNDAGWGLERNYRVGTIPSAASCGQLDMTSSCRGLAARGEVSNSVTEVVSGS